MENTQVHTYYILKMQPCQLRPLSSETEPNEKSYFISIFAINASIWRNFRLIVREDCQWCGADFGNLQIGWARIFDIRHVTHFQGQLNFNLSVFQVKNLVKFWHNQAGDFKYQQLAKSRIIDSKHKEGLRTLAETKWQMISRFFYIGQVCHVKPVFSRTS